IVANVRPGPLQYDFRDQRNQQSRKHADQRRYEQPLMQIARIRGRKILMKQRRIFLQQRMIEYFGGLFHHGSARAAFPAHARPRRRTAWKPFSIPCDSASELVPFDETMRDASEFSGPGA